MPNQIRLAKINEEILRELGDLLPRLKDPRVNAGNGQGLVSITRVDTTRDMRLCKVYVSLLSDTLQPKDVLKGLVSAAGFLRRELGMRLKLRMTPQLQFEMDNSIARGNHILNMMKSLNTPTESTAETDEAEQ